MERLTPSRLQANLYRLLDRVLSTGEPLEVESRGGHVKIVAADGGGLYLLKPHPDYVAGDLEDLAHLDWSNEWLP